MKMFLIQVALACSILMTSVFAAPPAVETQGGEDAAPIFVPLADSPKKVTPRNMADENAEFWRAVGLKQLEKVIGRAEKAKDPSYQRKAKNVIIFIGDGMGMTSITAGRIYKGQYLQRNSGEEETLVFDDFAHTALSKTYNTDKQVPDSAGTATAMFTGVKTDSGAIGVDNTRNRTNAEQGSVTSFMNWAQAEGKRTGIVTTTRITHATPSSTYAHIYHRDWECDTMVPAESVGIHVDIARQLVENAPGNKFNVIMGGGLSPMGAFNEKEESTVKFEGGTEKICKRGDNRNLAQEWLDMATAGENRAFVQTREQLMALDLTKTDRVMGLFRNNHITYSIARQNGEPSLREMTEAAIKVLERPNSEGFVLMVEGGRIDQAHHQNYARAALHEVLELDMAVEAAIKATDPAETLIIVTADHSHAMTFNGYPARGTDITGIANADHPVDPMLYEVLTYANGPGYYDHLANGTLDEQMAWKPLGSISAEELSSPTYRHMATVPLSDETHGGEDVVVFAHGPGSSLVRGVFEQNYLAYVMSYAGCMGPAKNFDGTCKTIKSGAEQNAVSLLLLTLGAAVLSVFSH